MFTRIGADVHPPLYYILLRGWAALWNGDTYALRAFSYAFGLLTAGAMYMLSVAIYRRRDIAVIAAALFLTNSFVIQYLMEARMYTLGCFLLVLAAWVLVRAVDGVRETRSFACAARWLAFGILAGLALLTHYYAGLYILALGLYGLARVVMEGWTTKGKFIMQGLMLSAVTATLMFLPWLKIFIAQVTQVTESYWIGGVTRWSVPETLFKMLTGVNGHPEKVVQQIAMLAVLILVLWATWRSVRRSSLVVPDIDASRRALLLPFLIVVPFFLSIVLSLKTSIYLDRYFIYSLPFLLPAIVAAFASLESRAARISLMTLVFTGSAILFPLRWYSLDLNNKPGMRAITTSLDERITPNDHVVVGSSFVLFTYRFHKTNAVHELLYAPNPLLHYSGTALLADGDTITSLDTIPVGAHVWTIDTKGFGNYQLPIPSTWERESELTSPDMYDFRGDIILREWSAR